MKLRITAMLASAAALAFGATSAFAQEPAAPAAAEAAPAPPALQPPMTAPLSLNPSPMSVDLGPLGHKVYVGGVLSGLGMTQNHHVAGDQATWGDLSNAQIFVNKNEGVFQYFVDVGAYSFPALGTLPYAKATDATSNTYDILPFAYIKVAPTANFSIQAGKMGTLIGAEYAMTYQNSNIERGLLWGLEPVVVRGVQANYSTGPLTFNVALTDGFYSNEYTTVSGAATWVVSPTDTLIFQGQGNTKKSLRVGGATAPVYNNEQVFDVIWTHVMGPLSLTPYFQYTHVPKFVAGGIGQDTDTWGGALLATYTFDTNGPLKGFSLPTRFEYVKQSNGANVASPLFGPGSEAWSLTLTPTYTYQRYFIRGEMSYTGITIGSGFGDTGTAKDQLRGLLEVGVLF